MLNLELHKINIEKIWGEAGDLLLQCPYSVIMSNYKWPGNISSRSSSNSEAFDSELLENLENISSVLHI